MSPALEISGLSRFFGHDVTATKPDKRAHRGLARTYQIITLFARNTLAHNVVMALAGLRRDRFDAFRPLSGRHDLWCKARATLERVGLAHLADRIVACCWTSRRKDSPRRSWRRLPRCSPGFGPRVSRSSWSSKTSSSLWRSPTTSSSSTAADSRMPAASRRSAPTRNYWTVCSASTEVGTPLGHALTRTS